MCVWCGVCSTQYVCGIYIVCVWHVVCVCVELHTGPAPTVRFMFVVSINLEDTLPNT